MACRRSSRGCCAPARAGSSRSSKGMAVQVNALEDDFVAAHRRRAARGDRPVPGPARRRRDARRPAAGGVRHGPRGRQAHPGPAPLRRPDDGRRRAAPGQHRRDEDRRGQDPGRHRPGLPERARRQGRARRHGQRLPGRVPVRADGPRAPLPRPDGRLHPVADEARTSAASSTRPTSPTAPTTSSASTTCATTWPGRRRARPARPQLRDRRRGRLDPHRRGPHAADHQRPGRPADQVVRRVRRDRRSGCSATRDYEVDEKKRTVGILESGIERVEDYLGIENLYESATPRSSAT